MNIDCLFTGLASFAVEDSSSTGRNSHTVDELVKVANELVVVMNGNVLTQHPVGQCLHQFGSLFAVKSG